jgi:hypothetical protein
MAEIIQQVVGAVQGMFGDKPKTDDVKSPNEMKDEDFIKEVDAVYSLIDQKYVYERQWYLNLSFLLGQQHVKWSNKLKKLYEPKVPEWRVRHVSNDIMPSYRKDLAKLNKNRPTLFISAGKKGPDGDIAAREANHLIEYWWSSPVIGMENELTEWKQYALSCGTGWLKPHWDPTIGTERSKTVGEETVNWRDGEVMLEACSPFEIVFDPPDAKKIKDLRAIMHYKIRSLDYIKARYPGAGDKVVDEKDTNSAMSFWQKIQGMVGTSNDGGVAMPDKADKSAVVKELWIYPCARFPKGQKIVSANKVMLEKGDLPYKWLGSDEPFVPLVPVYDIKVPGRLWGRSKIEDEIPIQQAKNELISHVRESERLCSKPKFLKPVGCGVDNITSEPGENVEWDPTTTNGAKPEWMVPPPIPNYVINGLGEIYQRDFANVASIHEISRGQVPPGVSSGVAINYLQEQDDTIIGDVVRQYERSLEIVGNMMLAIASQNYLENRKLQIVGDSGQADEFEYKVARKDEKDQVIEKGTIPEGARLVVEAGSSLPRTQTAKQAFILDLYKIGVLGPKGDKATNKRAIKLLEMGNIDEMYEEEAADRAQSEVENEGMKNGTEFMVYPYQDHEVHLQSHEALMKSPEFMSVGESVKMLFDAHRKAHQDLIAPPAPMPGEPPA